MDNPLTTAELSRLRKAIQHRDRLTSQGLVTSAVDSKISSALSNLKLYLPTQTQLAAVLKDWEVSDFTKRSQITIWLQQNILNDDSSRASTPPPANPPRPTFVHPPPPPPLPSRSGSLVLRPDLNRPSPSVTPTPALAQVTSPQVPSGPNNTPREIHTQASLKPPTPPPKDRTSALAQESLTRRHTFAGRPQDSRQSSNLVQNPLNEHCTGSSSGSKFYPVPFSKGHNSSQLGGSSLNTSNVAELIQPSRGSQPAPQSHSHTPDPNRPGHLGHDSSQPYVSPTFGQPTHIPQSSGFGQGYSQQQNVFAQGIQGGTSLAADPPHNQQFMTTLANIQAQQAQQTSVLLQQISQTQQPSTSNTIAQIFAAAQHQQAQQQANLFQQLQAQQATSSNSTTQLLANIQQQQQAQSNQMMSMLQQYQQSATNFNPYQNAQQNQQMLDLLSQTQSGGAPPVDWASLANASGMDPNMLMSMMMGGMDPTNIAIQGASFMFG
ncbi:hypothetical protein RHS04_01952 [Rhizoctonia solani]|uniref:Uncharacterized protein n=1 Tax=Rhizoctonia solani TaxID=456999 RepID=A0A8H7LK96_9AGAM|nr:hypothetical protein RHS04_01952 [Rhizoctonia solani]